MGLGGRVTDRGFPRFVRLGRPPRWIGGLGTDVGVQIPDRRAAFWYGYGFGQQDRLGRRHREQADATGPFEAGRSRIRRVAEAGRAAADVDPLVELIEEAHVRRDRVARAVVRRGVRPAGPKLEG